VKRLPPVFMIPLHEMDSQQSDILWILGAMNTVNIGTCLDTGHAYLSGDL
jgi:sugar phosphate isomerase/epimerase